MRPTWKKSRTPSALVHLRTRFWSRRLRASATPSALRWAGWAPNGSSMELDWSRRETRGMGLARLIGAVYGTEGSFPAIPATRGQPRYGLPVGHGNGGKPFMV